MLPSKHTGRAITKVRQQAGDEALAQILLLPTSPDLTFRKVSRRKFRYSKRTSTGVPDQKYNK